MAGDFSHGRETAPLSERRKLSVNKHNVDAVLAACAPRLTLTVENTLVGDGREQSVALAFARMNDFTPEAVARQIPALSAMLAMRSLLRDLKANLLDNQTFRRALEDILRDPGLSAGLRSELAALAGPEGAGDNDEQGKC